MKRAFFFLFILFTGITVFGQTGVAKAQSMFIYNFSRLIEWPAADKQGDFIIGVLGSSDIFGELETFCAGKKAGLQNFAVKKFKDAGEITKCQILFVSYSKSASIPEVLSKIGSDATLVVAEKKGAIESGAAICFVLTEDKLKFEMKSANATKLGLKINSKLEEMAMTKY